MSNNSISVLCQALQAPQQALPVQDSLGHPTAPPFIGLQQTKRMHKIGDRRPIVPPRKNPKLSVFVNLLAKQNTYSIFSPVN
jgi:hypothetical protein